MSAAPFAFAASSAPARGIGGEPDIAVIASLIASPSRSRLLLALNDGRALPSSVLAAEAGVSPSTASEHLGLLVEAGLLQVETQGRNRYYRLAGAHVGQLIESLTQLAPVRPIRSLREGTRAHALRTARTCYDHLAGRLGVEIMAALLRQRWVIEHDGPLDPTAGGRERLSAAGHDVDYCVTRQGDAMLADFGVSAPAGNQVRYCVDWSEQRHHIRGTLGRALCVRVESLGWVTRSRTGRAVSVTPAGRAGLRDALRIDWD